MYDQNLDNMNQGVASDSVAIELRLLDSKLGEEEDGGKMTTVGKKLNAETHKAKHWWNTIFILSCAFAIFNDPMFCYITTIDYKNKCVIWNINMGAIYIYCRTATDVFDLLDLFISKCGCCCCCCRGRRSSCKSCATNLLSILSRVFVCLPIAQIYVGRGMSVASDTSTAEVLLLVTLLQYTLRICFTYDWLKRRPIIDIARVKKWVKLILGFTPFILASHIFGAFWYFFATRRLLQCWKLTQSKIIGDNQDYSFGVYTLGTFICDEWNPNKTYDYGTKIWLWDDLCPVKEAKPEAFDFGIYFYALQSDVANPSLPFIQRLFQCFWWALRNLSSFGSNLYTSMNTSEITFSVLISITGMALFLVYLNAHVKEAQEISKRRMLEEKKQLMKPDIDLWLSKYYPSIDKEKTGTSKRKTNLEALIMENIHKLEENSDLDAQNVLGILPIKNKQCVMCVLFTDSWKKVSMFQTINDKLVKAICQHLVPLTYTEDSYIVQRGKPVGKMFLFIQGTAVACPHGETSSGFSSTKWLGKGDFYGDELLNWAFKSPSFSDLPTWTTNVIAQEKVEVFAIRAKDLKSICFKFWWFFSREVNGSQLERWEYLAASSIQAAWRHRKARKRLAASYVQPTKWFPRRTRTTGPTHWNRFVVN